MAAEQRLFACEPVARLEFSGPDLLGDPAADLAMERNSAVWSEGVDMPIEPNTAADYRWRLSTHLLPYFAALPLNEIDRERCQAFKAYKLRQAAD